MSNTIDVEESTLSFNTEKTHVVSAYIQKEVKDAPADVYNWTEFIYQFTVAMAYGSGNVERYGSQTYSTYDETLVEMNKYLKEFYES
jgi:hypothetical protein